MNATLCFVACVIAEPSFEGCRWGVYAEQMKLKSTENTMLLVPVQTGMGTAYRVDHSGFMNVVILNNKVHTLYHGIDLRFNPGSSPGQAGAQQVLVEGNDITFGAFDCSSACPSYSGINVAEGNQPAESSMIKGNTIRYSEGLPSRYGISLLATNNWVVADNTLLMENNTSNLYGVLLDGCLRTEVSCNTITSELNTWINDRQAAIRNFMGSDPLISCNYMDRTTNGLLFNGVIDDTDVRGNQINEHKWGLRLGFNTVIGLQELKGNLWYYDPFPIGGWAAWCQDEDDAPDNPFLVNPTGGNTWPPSMSPASGWFDFLFGPNYNCADDEGEDYCSQFKIRGKERLTELDERVANDSLENDPYTEETKWMLKGDLYKKLDENPELQDSLQIMAEFYAELQGSTTAAFKVVDDEQQVLYDLDSSLVEQLQASSVQIDSLMALVQDGLEEMGDSTLTSAQREAILSVISDYREDIRDLSIGNSEALQEAAEEKALAAGNAQTTNAAVSASELIESNQKQVNDIYLATIGKDVEVLTTDQAAMLLEIANQCPMLGGNAVFKARSLYGLLDGSYYYDDSLLCAPYGIEVKRLKEQRANAVSIVPNPAVDEATVVWTMETEVAAYLTLYNTMGSEVLRVLIPKGVARQVFTTSGLAPGLYHYKVLSANGPSGDGKLTIVR